MSLHILIIIQYRIITDFSNFRDMMIQICSLTLLTKRLLYSILNIGTYNLVVSIKLLLEDKSFKKKFNHLLAEDKLQLLCVSFKY